MNCYHMGFSDSSGNPQDLPKGKYMRPLFCLAMCAALGGNPEQAIPAAASIELAHRTSLIFDDIQDQGRQRNNRETVWSIWGANQAINAGLCLSCYGRLALLRLREKEVPDGITLMISSVLEKAVIELCYGQSMDVSFMERLNVGFEDYQQMVRGKTGALFGAASEVGALIAGKGDSTAELARGFGINMGIAFQIRDDYLGVWGEENQVGKTANDLIQKKRSLPVVLAMEMAPGYPQVDTYTIDRCLKQDQVRPEDAAIFKGWMEKVGIPEKVQTIEADFIQKARQTLGALPLNGEWRAYLDDVVLFLTERML